MLCACVCACVHACMCACMHACMRACVHAFVRGCVLPHALVCMRAWVPCWSVFRAHACRWCVCACLSACARAYVRACVRALRAFHAYEWPANDGVYAGLFFTVQSEAIYSKMLSVPWLQRKSLWFQ